MSGPKIVPSALTITAKGLARQLITPCFVSEGFSVATTPSANHPKGGQFRALWDTGATASVITQPVIDALGLKPTGMTNVMTAAGKTVAPTFVINIGLGNGVMVEHVNVTRGDMGGGVEVLIGMDIITIGDFSITNLNGRTVFSFRTPSMHEVDFVKQINAAAKAAPSGQRGPTPGQSFFGGKKKR